MHGFKLAGIDLLAARAQMGLSLASYCICGRGMRCVDDGDAEYRWLRTKDLRTGSGKALVERHGDPFRSGRCSEQYSRLNWDALARSWNCGQHRNAFAGRPRVLTKQFLGIYSTDGIAFTRGALFRIMVRQRDGIGCFGDRKCVDECADGSLKRGCVDGIYCSDGKFRGALANRHMESPIQASAQLQGSAYLILKGHNTASTSSLDLCWARHGIGSRSRRFRWERARTQPAKLQLEGHRNTKRSAAAYRRNSGSGRSRTATYGRASSATKIRRPLTGLNESTRRLAKPEAHSQVGGLRNGDGPRRLWGCPTTAGKRSDAKWLRAATAPGRKAG